MGRVSFVEKRPRFSGWIEARYPAVAPRNLADSCWIAVGESDVDVVVLSSLVLAELPNGSGDSGLQWHVSISCGTGRPGRVLVRRVLREFDMAGAEEDNHHPGRARHFWRPLDPAARVACECKQTEITVTEPDGYRWTNPRPGEGPCRGCEHAARFGSRCPLHP